jgi:hypothetical protein
VEDKDDCSAKSTLAGFVSGADLMRSIFRCKTDDRQPSSASGFRLVPEWRDQQSPPTVSKEETKKYSWNKSKLQSVTGPRWTHPRHPATAFTQSSIAWAINSIANPHLIKQPNSAASALRHRFPGMSIEPFSRDHGSLVFANYFHA